MPTYNIVTDTAGRPAIKVTPGEDDQFLWSTTGSKVANGLLICGQTKTKAGKLVQLKVKIEGRPELQEMLVELQRLQMREVEAKAARQEKINTIPGLAALRAAYSAVSNTHAEYERKGEYGYPAKEAAAWHKAEEAASRLQGVYPIAAAFLMAEGWTRAANDMKSSAGQKGMERIINGENHVTVLEEMRAEWSAAAHRAVENS